MNNKGFTLIELLGCLVLIGVVFGVGIYFTSGTLSTTLTTVDKISENEIKDTAEVYILENYITWKMENNLKYACVSISDMVDLGYFKYEEVSAYKDNFVKIFRDINTKVINDRIIVKECN